MVLAQRLDLDREALLEQLQRHLVLALLSPRYQRGKEPDFPPDIRGGRNPALVPLYMYAPPQKAMVELGRGGPERKTFMTTGIPRS